MRSESETRNSNDEIRNKLETQNAKQEIRSRTRTRTNRGSRAALRVWLWKGARCWWKGCDLGDGFVFGAEDGAFGVECVELAEYFFEGALACGFLAAEKTAAFVLGAEIGLDGLVVAVGDADESGREPVAKGFELVQFGFEGLSLLRGIPFADDGLEVNFSAKWHFVCGGADLNGGPKRFFEFFPALVDGPVLSDFALGEVNEAEGPPFFDFKGTLEPRGEGVEESKLPIVELRELVEH